MVQALPGADEQVVAQIESQVLEIGNISSSLLKVDSLETLLQRIMGNLDYQIIGKQELEFCCTCNRERLEVILSSYSQEEIEGLCDDQGIVEVTCNFCNEQYHYTAEQIMKAKKPQP